MDQCTDKCRCLTGVNQETAYECAQPCESGFFFEKFTCDCYPDEPVCPNGAAVTVTSYVQVRQGLTSQETTFFASVAGVTPNGPARVMGQALQIYAGDAWVDVGVVPYAKGDDYNGKEIIQVVHTAIVAPDCN